MNGVLFFQTNLAASEFIIKNCSFSRCTSSYGGAMYINGVLFYYLF
jgi:hypothetical protein